MNWMWSVLIGLAFLGFQYWMYRQSCAAMAYRCDMWDRSCASGARRAQTRESAITDLERSLAMTPESGSLRRLGVVAPLLGVTLTAGSVLLSSGTSGALFTALQGLNGASESGGVSVVSAIVPLFWGVCIGAALAIFNQVLVSIAHRKEDHLFHDAIAPNAAHIFLLTDDRIEQVVSQIALGGRRLTKTSALMKRMLTHARLAMESMNDACNATCTDLKSVATSLQEAIHLPIKDFVSAARDMRTAAEDSAKQFGAGAHTLGRQAEIAETQITESLKRQVEATDRQVAIASALAETVRIFEASFEPLRNQTLPAFEQQVKQSTVAVGRAAEAFATVEKQCAATVVSLDRSSQDLVATVNGLAANGFEPIHRSVALLADCVNDVTRVVAEADKSAALGADAARRAMETLAKAVHYNGVAVAQSLAALSSNMRTAAAPDSPFATAMGGTTSALTAMSASVRQIEFGSMKASSEAASSAIRDLNSDMAAARAQLKQQSHAMSVLIFELESAAARLRTPSLPGASTKRPGGSH